MIGVGSYALVVVARSAWTLDHVHPATTTSVVYGTMYIIGADKIFHLFIESNVSIVLALLPKTQNWLLSPNLHPLFNLSTMLLLNWVALKPSNVLWLVLLDRKWFGLETEMKLKRVNVYSLRKSQLWMWVVINTKFHLPILSWRTLERYAHILDTLGQISLLQAVSMK